MAVSPNVISVHPSVPAKTVKELIELIKGNPGKYTFASPGVGSTPHLAGERLRLTQGIDLVPVVFGGSGPAIQSTLGAHTPIAITVLSPAVQPVKEGMLRALAVTSEKRSPALPDVPTMAEAGLSGHASYTLTGFLAPAGTPKAIIQLLHREIVNIVAFADVRERLDAQGFEVVGNSPDEFGDQIKSEGEKWGKIIRDANIKPEQAR